MQPVNPKKKPQDGLNPYWLTPTDNANKSHEYRRLSASDHSRREAMQSLFGDAFYRNEVVARLAPAQPLGKILGPIVEELGAHQGGAIDRLLERWPEIVGPAIAKVTLPGSIQNGTLYVEVTGSSWLYILEREHKARILAKVKEAMGTDEIRFIRLVQAGRR